MGKALVGGGYEKGYTRDVGGNLDTFCRSKHMGVAHWLAQCCNTILNQQKAKIFKLLLDKWKIFR
jgi:hypothetical protein